VTPTPEQPDAASSASRQDEVIREIRTAGHAATTPVEVYRTALARVTPLVDASFASVFLRDPDVPHLLRLACAQNWPQQAARFLSEMRIRVGRGPTGLAVAMREPVEVPDVFEDPDLEPWWEAARELGFTAITTHPLTVDAAVVGAISFYFEDPQTLDAEERRLLSTVARELATVAESAGD
jgi:GAF domain-containing protein